jgi:uncharacterized membrane-anchored protein YhcB (DUF1043 family)
MNEMTKIKNFLKHIELSEKWIKAIEIMLKTIAIISVLIGFLLKESVVNFIAAAWENNIIRGALGAAIGWLISHLYFYNKKRKKAKAEELRIAKEKEEEKLAKVEFFLIDAARLLQNKFDRDNKNYLDEIPLFNPENREESTFFNDMLTNGEVKCIHALLHLSKLGYLKIYGYTYSAENIKFIIKLDTVNYFSDIYTCVSKTEKKYNPDYHGVHVEFRDLRKVIHDMTSDKIFKIIKK